MSCRRTATRGLPRAYFRRVLALAGAGWFLPVRGGVEGGAADSGLCASGGGLG
jgi:hypothetical protein